MVVRIIWTFCFHPGAPGPRATPTSDTHISDVARMEVKITYFKKKTFISIQGHRPLPLDLSEPGSEPDSLSIDRVRRRPSRFGTASANLLGLTDPCSTAVHMEPFSTSEGMEMWEKRWEEDQKGKGYHKIQKTIITKNYKERNRREVITQIVTTRPRLDHS